jgi:PAS domain-containing protein
MATCPRTKGEQVGGRPWGPIKTDDPVIRDLVDWLRGLVTASEQTSRELAPKCGCGPTLFSERLSGEKTPTLEFVNRLIEATTRESEWPRKKQQARHLLKRRASTTARPPAVVDAYTRVVQSQDETRNAQARTIRVLDELSHAKEQLLVSLRLEYQAATIIRALRIVLLHLAGVGEEFADERELARTQLGRADRERERAARLADAAQLVLEALGQRFTADAPSAPPEIPPDVVMVNLPAGLANVQRILDEQESQLGRLESEQSAEARAERLFTQYVDAPMPVAILDAEDRFLRANEQFRETVHYTADELGRMHLADIARSWTDWNDHLILPKEGEVLRFQLRRWPVSGCQIVVLENADDPELGFPTVPWLKKWFDGYGGFESRKLGVCQVSFDTASIPDDAWDEDELETRFCRDLFQLTSEGQLVVEVDATTYLLLIDSQVFALDKFIEDTIPRLEEIGNGLPFMLDAADCGTYRTLSPDELLWRIDTSARWAAVEGRSQLWIVREPVFPGAPDGPADEPVLYRPLSDAAGRVQRVQVVNAISPTVFRSAVEQLRRWLAQGWYTLGMDFLITADDLRIHDWRGELSNDRMLNLRVRLMLDELRDFESYVLLRRFGDGARAGVRHSRHWMQGRVWELGLQESEANLVPGVPADGQGIQLLLSE